MKMPLVTKPLRVFPIRHELMYGAHAAVYAAVSGCVPGMRRISVLGHTDATEAFAVDAYKWDIYRQAKERRR